MYAAKKLKEVVSVLTGSPLYLDPQDIAHLLEAVPATLCAISDKVREGVGVSTLIGEGLKGGEGVRTYWLVKGQMAPNISCVTGKGS